MTRAATYAPEAIAQHPMMRPTGHVVIGGSFRRRDLGVGPCVRWALEHARHPARPPVRFAARQLTGLGIPALPYSHDRIEGGS